MSVVSLRIYADGSCLKNPGHGGWSFVVYDSTNKKLFEDSGSEPETTNNRMELQAAICAAEYSILAGTYSGQQHGAPREFEVEIITDSQYVKQGVTTWIHSWVKNNWKASGGGAVKNQDLWERLNELNKALSIKWSWVKGHSGDEGNERADVLARQAAELSQRSDPNSKRTAPTPVGKPHPPKAKTTEQTAPPTKTTTGDKLYLEVPFAEKDDAKKLGARWDPQQKQWYCLPQQRHALRRWL